MHTKPVQNDTRNYGIDALRLFSMFLVVAMHVLRQGGVLGSVTGVTLAFAWLFEVIAYCSVNCFALISGYLTYTEREKPYRYSKYISLWLQVAFYSFGVTAVAWLIRPDAVGVKTVLLGALPVLTGRYWYFEAYTALFFLIPWLNRFIRSCKRRELNLLMLVLFAIFSCYGNLGRIADGRFGLENGYSFVWLALLYLAGAWMKKYDLPHKVRRGAAAACLIACVAVTWLYTILFRHAALLSYLSPTVVLMSASMLILFADLQFGPGMRRLLRCTAPAAFGVYLVHLQPVLFQYLLSGSFTWIAGMSAWAAPLMMLACALTVFLASLLAELVRMRIFSLLRINEIAEKLWNRTGRRIVRKAIRSIARPD